MDFKNIAMILVLTGVALGIVGLSKQLTSITDTIATIPQQISEKIDKSFKELTKNLPKLETKEDLSKVCTDFCKLR